MSSSIVKGGGAFIFAKLQIRVFFLETYTFWVLFHVLWDTITESKQSTAKLKYTIKWYCTNASPPHTIIKFIVWVCLFVLFVSVYSATSRRQHCSNCTRPRAAVRFVKKFFSLTLVVEFSLRTLNRASLRADGIERERTKCIFFLLCSTFLLWVIIQQKRNKSF